MASKRNKRRKECEGKKIYRDTVVDGKLVKAIDNALYDVRMLLKHRGEHCHPYHCSVGHLHVGHHTRENRRAYAARFGTRLR
jgi:hypothetical protein